MKAAVIIPKGWRKLKINEVIVKGDMWFCPLEREWVLESGYSFAGYTPEIDDNFLWIRRKKKA